MCGGAHKTTTARLLFLLRVVTTHLFLLRGGARDACRPRLFASAYHQMPIAVLSPAKSLDEKSDFSAVPMTQPPFLEGDTADLIATCQGLSQANIKALMSLSDPLAKLNYERFRSFASQPEMPAAFAFDGVTAFGTKTKSSM